MNWCRDGDDWILKNGRRKVGRVFRDSQYSDMWRSYRADGQLSDMANLSWAKNAVLIAAERELEFGRRAIDPPKCPEKGDVFESRSSPMRYFRQAAE